jgi:hypothetical protein
MTYIFPTQQLFSGALITGKDESRIAHKYSKNRERMSSRLKFLQQLVVSRRFCGTAKEVCGQSQRRHARVWSPLLGGLGLETGESERNLALLKNLAEREAAIEQIIPQRNTIRASWLSS